MKTLTITLLLLCFTHPTFGQNAKPPKKSKLIVSYDKFRDTTNVSTFPRTPKGGVGILISGYFNHEGTAIAKPIEQMGLVFDSFSSNWQFLKEEDRQLFVIADGERFEFTGASRDSDVNRNYGRYSRVTVTERLIFVFDREHIGRLLAARNFEMRLGIHGRPLSFGNETLADLRELITRMKPQP